MVQPSRTGDDAVVLAARAGDRDAMNELARRHLPMVYNLVRQALLDEADVDDVVQDVMVRALAQLPKLRAPGSFRAWLTAIAVHQVGSHLTRARVRFRRTAPLAAAADRPDAAADVEGPALLRAEVAAQRRQVRHAIRWLDGDERTVFALWWLELAGQLSRADLAAGLGISVAHAGVRIQRMRERLEAGRRVVAALEALDCGGLDEVVARWNGVPGPYWRKRIERHVRSCPVCGRAGDELVPAEPLLAGIALLPVPIALAGALLAKALADGSPATAVAGAAGWLSRTLYAATVHPVAATLGVGVLAVGITVPATGLTTSPAEHTVAVGTLPRPGPPVPPVNAPDRLPKGRLSLESAAAPGRFVAVDQEQGVLAAANDPAARQRATLVAVTGLSDAACFSLRDLDGRYLRHSSFRLRTSPDEGTVLFRRDATFCARAGFAPGAVSLESANFPGFFLRHVGDQLWIDQFDGSDTFRAESSFHIRPPLA